MLYILFIVALIMSWAITYFIRSWAIKKRLLDKPNQRSYHTRITPLGGGIAIVTCWYVCISFLLAFDSALMPPELFKALCPGVLLLLIGIKDDATQLSPWVRLLVQCAIVLLSMYFIGGLDKIDFGSGLIFENKLIINIFVFIAFIWYINLFNFYDGIDGNLGTESIAICLMSLFFIPVCSNPLIYMIACVGGFLKLNWQKAKIFMGDAGSTFLGFTFAVFGLYFQNKYNFPIVLWVLLCMVAIFDTTYTVIRRLFYKENILTPHKNQMFHRLVSSGYSHQKVVLIQQCLNIVVFIGVYVANQNHSYIILSCISVLLIFGLYSIWVEKRYPWQKMPQNKIIKGNE